MRNCLIGSVAIALLVTSLAGMPAFADSSGEIQLIDCNTDRCQFFQWPEAAASQPPPDSGFQGSNFYARWDRAGAPVGIGFGGANIKIFKRDNFDALNFYFNCGTDTLNDTQVNVCFGSNLPPRTFQVPIRLRDLKLFSFGSNWYFARLIRNIAKETVERNGGSFPEDSYLVNVQINTDMTDDSRSFVLGKIIVDTINGGQFVPDRLKLPAVLKCDSRYYCADQTKPLSGRIQSLRDRLKQRLQKPRINR